ncbi:MAG: hypothetical protein HQ472_04615, partial [Ignavibacteria bacterium]|nr:hypothetical protein [Ignavibacteria bacterium]
IIGLLSVNLRRSSNLVFISTSFWTFPSWKVGWQLDSAQASWTGNLACSKNADTLYVTFNRGLIRFVRGNTIPDTLYRIASLNLNQIVCTPSHHISNTNFLCTDIRTGEDLGKGLPWRGADHIASASNGIIATTEDLVSVRKAGTSWQRVFLNSWNTPVSVSATHTDSMSVVFPKEIGLYNGFGNAVRLVSGFLNADIGYKILYDGRKIQVYYRERGEINIYGPGKETDFLGAFLNIRAFAVLPDSSMVVVGGDGRAYYSPHYQSKNFTAVYSMRVGVKLDALTSNGKNVLVVTTDTRKNYYTSTNSGQNWREYELLLDTNRLTTIFAISRIGKVFLLEGTRSGIALAPFTYTVYDMSITPRKKVAEYSNTAKVLTMFVLDEVNNTFVLAGRNDLLTYGHRNITSVDEHDHLRASSAENQESLDGYFDLLGRRMPGKTTDDLPAGLYLRLSAGGTSTPIFIP